MTQITYSTLTPLSPENVNDLNTRLTEVKTVINGNLDSGNLAANSVGTSELVDGSVTSAKLASAVGAPSSVATQLIVGNTGQTAAGAYPGRILGATDFTGLGLAAPVGLYNLSSTADSSGNARTLTNKGTVTFDTGITGSASTAAQFTGAVGQAFYIADTGASDPFRLKTGSVGCWFRTAKRGTTQELVTKWAGAGTRAWGLEVGSSNVLNAYVSTDGTATTTTATSVSDVCDDRWHLAQFTADGTTVRLYIDGVMEASAAFAGAIFGGAAPFNIGGYGADGGTNATGPHFGRIDEAFVTADALSDDEIRSLYCSKIAHSYPATPKQTWVEVRRQRRGADWATGDFPSSPPRLHAGGSLTDLGTNATNLTANNTPVQVAGPDGTTLKAYNFVAASSQSLSATDTGLPAGTTTKTYGCWFKTSQAAAAGGIIGYGTVAGALAAYARLNGAGVLIIEGTASITGPFVADGQWHLLTVVEDNGAIDGVKTKCYLDGRCVASGTTMSNVTLAGAGRLRIGCYPDATTFLGGQVGPSFVHSVALTPNQVATLYDKSSQQLTSSPKNEGDHIEGMDSTYLYLDMSSLQSNSLVDIQVQG